MLYADPPLTRSQLDVIEECLEEEDSPVKARRESHSESIKVTQFARPPSTHDDSPLGFAFTKAKLPQMDFTRKLVQQNPGSKVDTKVLETSVKALQEPPPCEIRDTRVTSVHFPPSRDLEPSISLDNPPPPLPESHQGSGSSRENVVDDPKMPTVRDHLVRVKNIKSW